MVLFGCANRCSLTLCKPVVVTILEKVCSWIASRARACSNKRVHKFRSCRTHRLHNASCLSVAISVSVGGSRAAGTRSGSSLAVRADALPFRTDSLSIACCVAVRRCSLKSIVPTDGAQKSLFTTRTVFKTRSSCGLAVATDGVPSTARGLRLTRLQPVRCLRLERVCTTRCARLLCGGGCPADFLTTVTGRLHRTRCCSVAVASNKRVLAACRAHS